MRPAFVLFLVALAALAFWLERDRAPLGTADELKLVSDPASCAECHEKEVAAWRGSHHDLAMQHATEQTVLGDFGGAAFEHRGTTYRFFREGEGFRVGIGDATYAVPYTFGVDPLQQYLLDVGDGKLQALPVAWDVANRRWYAWYDEAFELGEPRFNWNHMCADCHSTYFRKAYDESARSYRSAWREIDVSCAACHPSVELHGGDPDDPFFLGVARSTSGADARNQHALDSCAQCHSRRAQFAEPLPRYAFLDAYEPSFITEPLYYPDGQIRDEVYVWGSFEQSKMKNAGVHCVDCHDPHSARLKHEGNAVCTECHRTDPPERFPTLKKRDYEAREHHRHEPGTRGSACIDCHMASRVYMGIDERHDHSFRIPRPDLTLAIGVPNACAKCHADKPASWAAETARTMGDGTAADQPHFGTAFATGDVEGLLRVAFGQAHPEIVAASAILRLGAIDDPRAREAVEEAARSELPLMRLAAIRAGARDVAELVPDGPLAVALAAAERAGILNAPLRARYEYLADRAEGPYNRALVHERRGEWEDALRDYRKALALEPEFVPAHFNCGNLLARLGRRREAEDQFRAVFEFDPENPEAHYSLGLLLAEMDRYAEAVPHMKRAATSRPRALYNLGVLLQRLERQDEALAAYEAAHERLPADNDVVYALALLHAQRGERAAAGKWIALLRERGDPRAAAFED